MDYCIECGRKLEEVELICSQCGEPICDWCHSGNGGMCTDCSDKFFNDEED